MSKSPPPPPFTDPASFATWLDSLSPRDQVQVCRTLANVSRTELAALADRIIYDRTRKVTRKATADEFGLTVRQVTRAVTTHAQRHPELAEQGVTEGETP